MEKPTIKLQFEGVDSWNRAVFKDINSKDRYGDTENLYSTYATEKDVLKTVKTECLRYFGKSFGCEPMGSRPNVNYEIIIKEGE